MHRGVQNKEATSVVVVVFVKSPPPLCLTAQTYKLVICKIVQWAMTPAKILWTEFKAFLTIFKIFLRETDTF